MSQSGLEDFGGSQKARQLFDLVAADMETLKTKPLCYRPVSQQIGSADSIGANIEEVTVDGVGSSTFASLILREALLVKLEDATNG